VTPEERNWLEDLGGMGKEAVILRADYEHFERKGIIFIGLLGAQVRRE